MFEKLLRIVAIPLIVIGWLVIFAGIVQGVGGLLFEDPLNDLQGAAALLSGLFVSLQGVLLLAAGGAFQLLVQQFRYFERLEQRLHAIETQLRR